jgi:hypothetical protein
VGKGRLRRPSPTDGQRGVAALWPYEFIIKNICIWFFKRRKQINQMSCSNNEYILQWLDDTSSGTLDSVVFYNTIWYEQFEYNEDIIQKIKEGSKKGLITYMSIYGFMNLFGVGVMDVGCS